MKTIFIAVAFGTSVRDVLRTNMFQRLRDRADIRLVILSPQFNDPAFVSEFGGERVVFEELREFSPTATERLLEALNRTLLRSKCRTIQLGNINGSSWTREAMRPLAAAMLWTLGDRRAQRFVGWMFRRFTPRARMSEVFARCRPDLVVLTRVLNFSLDYPVARQAELLGIPSVVLVSSWDNLTSKGFFPFGADWLVVWNEIMKEEAVSLFGFPPSSVFVSGVPRFDRWLPTPPLPGREDFFRQIGLDPAKRVITYATGTGWMGQGMGYTTPEPLIVQMLADATGRGEFGADVQLLVRLHPRADREPYAKLEAQPGIVIRAPGRASSYPDRVFSEEDDRELAATMAFSDVVVNLLSTITIDAALFDTPVVCVGFDADGPRPYRASVRRYYEFEHYAKLRATGCFRLAESADALLKEIREYLIDPIRDAEGRAEAVRRFVEFPEGGAGDRIGSFILSVMERPTNVDAKEREGSSVPANHPPERTRS